MLKDYGSWCPEVYRSLFVDRRNDDKLFIAPCCQAEVKIESLDTFDFNTSPHLTKLRQQFDAGEKPSACDACWTLETVGQKSRRQSAIEFYNIPPSSDVILEGLDHSATWACNLACVMCSPKHSSSWAVEEGLGKSDLIAMGRYFQRSNNFLEKIDTTKLKRLHFNGGEPLINNDQIDLLSKLEQQDILKNTFISYNTNGTIMPSKKIVDFWSKAKLVKLFFSIDAVESAFEYIRWPAIWQQTSENILDMKKSMPGNVMFGFNVAVGCYNILEVNKVWHWFNDNLKTNREEDPSDFCWQTVDEFDIGQLNKTAKQAVIKQLSTVKELNGLASYVKSKLDVPANDSWITKLDSIDKRRSTNWRKSLSITKYY